MADNISITPGSGANIATDEILGVKYPRSKMVLGDDGVNDGDVSENNPVPTTTVERIKNFHAHFHKEGVTSTTYAVLVDLSDTTNWPHNETGYVDISTTESQVVITSAQGANGSLRLGVITRIDGVDADIVWADCSHFSKSGSEQIDRSFNYSPSQIRFEISGGSLTQMVSNEVSLNVAAINTGITLESSAGISVTPAVGDVVLGMTVSSGTVTFVYDIMYHSED